MFEFIKDYYQMGLYTKDNLAIFKTSGMITLEQYDQLGGIIDEEA
ncbi:XkdX family protein [Latilactobacillus sakei]